MKRDWRRWYGMAGSLVIIALAGPLTGCGSGATVDSAGFNSAGVSPGTTAIVTPASAAGIKRDVDVLTASATPGSDAYKIGPQDILDISVFRVPDLTKKIQVADDGTINMPLVGAITAAGMTTRQVEENLTRLLGEKYLQNPQVTVMVSEYNSQRITIEGAVKRPGVYPIQGRLTLLQSIAVAQGFEKTADTTILIFRQENGRKAAARFEVSEIREGQARDPELRAGDVVVVKTSVAKETFENVVKVLPIARAFMFF